MKWKGVILGGGGGEGEEEDEPHQVHHSSDADATIISSDECEERITTAIKPNNNAANFDGYKVCGRVLLHSCPLAPFSSF